jgi:hypothetical protein
MGARSLAHSTGGALAGAADKTVRVTTAVGNAPAINTAAHRKRPALGGRTRVIGMALLGTCGSHGIIRSGGDTLFYFKRRRGILRHPRRSEDCLERANDDEP